jgi:hypothetical protein
VLEPVVRGDVDLKLGHGYPGRRARTPEAGWKHSKRSVESVREMDPGDPERFGIRCGKLRRCVLRWG